MQKKNNNIYVLQTFDSFKSLARYKHSNLFVQSIKDNERFVKFTAPKHLTVLSVTKYKYSSLFVKGRYSKIYSSQTFNCFKSVARYKHSSLFVQSIKDDKIFSKLTSCKLLRASKVLPGKTL